MEPSHPDFHCFQMYVVKSKLTLAYHLYNFFSNSTKHKNNIIGVCVTLIIDNKNVVYWKPKVLLREIFKIQVFSIIQLKLKFAFQFFLNLTFILQINL